MSALLIQPICLNIPMIREMKEDMALLLLVRGFG